LQASLSFCRSSHLSGSGDSRLSTFVCGRAERHSATYYFQSI